ncbi:MAG TPA: ArsR family transcriptional regulator [Planctomycetota bacterium]|nr:ArsR family transcriptional regulator [Planctomycetota bacterium]
MPPPPERISVAEARRRLTAGDPLLLVCVYPDASYRRSNLEGSISMSAFLARLPSLPRDAEIVFY